MNVEDIVRAHADERLAVPLAEIERRAGRRPRRRWAYAGAVVATAAAAVVGVGILRPAPGPEAAGFGEFCAEQAAAADPGRPALPPLRFELREDLWIYADATAIVTCRPDGVSTYRPPATAGANGGWPYNLTPRVISPEAPLAWAVGQTPSGTQRVEVVLPSGRVVSAEVNGGFYAASWTGETGFPTKVVATTAERIYTFENGATTFRPR